jgi:hypothetical protein
LVDNAVHHIRSLDETDQRAFDLRVANPAALVVAKTIKIMERDRDAAHRTALRLPLTGDTLW